MRHIPVLLNETVSALALEPDSTVIDATLGGGGHAREILKLLGPKGTYVGIDADPTAIEGVELEANGTRVILVNENFRHIKTIVAEHQLQPNAILADLGWRTDQFEESGKGFSFHNDEPLLMTFGDPSKHLFTADDVVNEWGEESLKDIIRGYGEERFAGRIAKAIVQAREQGRIKTAHALAEIIAAAVPVFGRPSKIHPATRTFQAIRIAVNDELGALKEFLEEGFQALAPGGRFAIISFHSLEDRMVKRFWNEQIAADLAIRLHKKPIIADESERAENPRSRSAKLRIIEKI
ncbi:16S rRNA (cytosine(1402)-N(4))-methyltransferase [Candidatus Kaiserbacteria bacterium RIFOXYB1_FULL_46_14]|uniref:Ribosomal RNA small subunit methyltransferase H n=1 Tax=Candidatus Kaiserbacteria bacterium RIFOXYB1_FULL_46_14 TaxID=1798531 RepID=A0A1F6FJJ6_9BACT|nr:MAG: 16S rRNA (cytosine(1402)-N(4))-methyltransferase [Candidatus Kaiserbacteria bacterium RIFOXYB1_FULL_46_14]